MKKFILGLSMILGASIAQAQTSQEAEKIIKAALDCQAAIDWSKFEKNLSLLGKKTKHPIYNSSYKLNQPIQYGKITIKEILYQPNSNFAFFYPTFMNYKKGYALLPDTNSLKKTKRDGASDDRSMYWNGKTFKNGKNLNASVEEWNSGGTPPSLKYMCEYQ